MSLEKALNECMMMHVGPKYTRLEKNSRKVVRAIAQFVPRIPRGG